MSNYNSSKIYNMGYVGGMYNSAYYIVVVGDTGSGADTISSLIASLAAVLDAGSGSESVQISAALQSILDSGVGSETVAVLATLATVLDSSVGVESIALNGSIYLSDSGVGADTISGLIKVNLFIDEDGYLQPLGVIVLKDSRYEAFPSLKEYSESIPGRHGTIEFGSHLGSRSLELHVYTPDGLTPEEKPELKRTYAKYLNPSAGTKTLVFYDDQEKMYYVKFSGRIDPTQYATWLDFTIPFKMADPYIYSALQYTQIGSGTIVNAGNVETYFIAEITGPFTNPSFSVGTNTVTYIGVVDSGETLIIDTEKMTAELDGVNVIENMSGDFNHKLSVGNNIVSADNKISILWYDRWV